MLSLLNCRLLASEQATIQRLIQLTQFAYPELLNGIINTQVSSLHPPNPVLPIHSVRTWSTSHHFRSLSSSSTPPTKPPPPQPNISKPNQPSIRINQQIKAPTVRVVFPSGENQILDIKAALQAARDLGLDLVEVAPNAQPPVARILDYSKHLHELRQQQQEVAKKHREQAKLESNTKAKEMRFTVKISDHDLETKMRKVEGFLADGYRTLLVVKYSFAKEEPAAVQALDYIVARLKNTTQVEVGPRQPVRRAVAVAVKPVKT